MKYKHIGMTTFSVQQTTKLVQLLAMIGTLVGIEVDQEVAATIIGGLVALTAFIIGFVDRYKKGDITWYGKRK